MAIYNSNEKVAHAFQKSSEVSTYKWDVGDFKACQDGVAQVTKEYGPIDILVNINQKPQKQQSIKQLNMRKSLILSLLSQVKKLLALSKSALKKD